MLPSGPPFGELSLTEVFVEYNGPQLFSCQNKQGVLFLAVHAPEIDEHDNWLYVEITHGRLDRLRKGLITLREAFSAPEDGSAYMVGFPPHEDAARFDLTNVEAASLPDDWLPEPDERLGPELTTALEEVSPLQSNAPVVVAFDDRLRQSVEAMLAGLPTPVFELPSDVLSLLRTLRTSVADAAEATGRAVFDLVFKTGQNRTDVPAAALGRVLTTSQTLVDALVSAAASGRSVAAIRESARLDAVAVFPGSFGIRIDTHRNDLFGDPALTSALSKLVDLLEASGSAGAMREMLRESGPRVAAPLRSFARALNNSHADLVVEFGFPGNKEARSVSLTRNDIGVFLSNLDEAAQQTSDIMLFRGRLVGVSLRTKYFRLENDDQSYSGRIADDYISQMSGKKINEYYDAAIAVITEIDEVTGTESQKYTLLTMDRNEPPADQTQSSSSDA